MSYALLASPSLHSPPPSETSSELSGPPRLPSFTYGNSFNAQSTFYNVNSLETDPNKADEDWLNDKTQPQQALETPSIPTSIPSWLTEELEEEWVDQPEGDPDGFGAQDFDQYSEVSDDSPLEVNASPTKNSVQRRAELSAKSPSPIRKRTTKIVTPPRKASRYLTYNRPRVPSNLRNGFTPDLTDEFDKLTLEQSEQQNSSSGSCVFNEENSIVEKDNHQPSQLQAAVRALGGPQGGLFEAQEGEADLSKFSKDKKGIMSLFAGSAEVEPPKPLEVNNNAGSLPSTSFDFDCTVSETGSIVISNPEKPQPVEQNHGGIGKLVDISPDCTSDIGTVTQNSVASFPNQQTFPAPPAAPETPVKLFEFQYDTFTRDHLGRLMDEFTEGKSFEDRQKAWEWETSFIDVTSLNKPAVGEMITLENEDDVVDEEISEELKRSSKRVRLASIRPPNLTPRVEREKKVPRSAFKRQRTLQEQHEEAERDGMWLAAVSATSPANMEDKNITTPLTARTLSRLEPTSGGHSLIFARDLENSILPMKQQTLHDLTSREIMDAFNDRNNNGSNTSSSGGGSTLGTSGNTAASSLVGSSNSSAATASTTRNKLAEANALLNRIRARSLEKAVSSPEPVVAEQNASSENGSTGDSTLLAHRRTSTAESVSSLLPSPNISSPSKTGSSSPPSESYFASPFAPSFHTSTPTNMLSDKVDEPPHPHLAAAASASIRTALNDCKNSFSTPPKTQRATSARHYVTSARQSLGHDRAKSEGALLHSDQVPLEESQSKHRNLTTIPPTEFNAILPAIPVPTRMVFDATQGKWVKVTRANGDKNDEVNNSVSTEDDPFKDFESTKGDIEVMDSRLPGVGSPELSRTITQGSPLSCHPSFEENISKDEKDLQSDAESNINEQSTPIKRVCTPRSALKKATEDPDHSYHKCPRSVSFSDGKLSGPIIQRDPDMTPTATSKHPIRRPTTGSSLKFELQANLSASFVEPHSFFGSSQGQPGSLEQQSSDSDQEDKRRNSLTDTIGSPMALRDHDTSSRSTSSSELVLGSFESAPRLRKKTHRRDTSTTTSATFRRTTAPDATFMTECSFGIARDMVIKYITDAQPLETDWEKLKSITLAHKGAESVARLKDFLPNLDQLDLSDNQLSYLTGIPPTVRSLILSSNRLHNLTAFGHLQNIERMDISNNQLDSVSQLSSLRHLRELKADNNFITDIDGLRDIDALQKLSLRGNAIERLDFSSVNWPRLESLCLSKNKIERVDHLYQLSSLAYLDLDHNELHEVNSLSPMNSLRILRLCSNPIRDLDIGFAPRLRTLYADSNKSILIVGLNKLRKLENLSIRDRGSDFMPNMFEIRDIKRLYLSGAAVPKQFYAERYFNLVYLEMAMAQITKLPKDFASLVPNLRSLNLNYNFVEDLSPLMGLVRLKSLSVYGARLNQYRGLATVVGSLPELEFADFRMNPLTLSFYPPLVLSEASITPSISNNYHVLRTLESGKKSSEWVSWDNKFKRSLPEKYRLKRETYRVLMVKYGTRLQTLDGLDCRQEQKRAERQMQKLTDTLETMQS